MKTITLAAAALAALASPVFAHPPGEDGAHGGFYPPPVAEQPRPVFNAAAASTAAQGVIGTMITRRVVAPSWRGLPAVRTELQTRGNTRRWVVTFRNDRVADRARRTLYVIFSESGDYLAANHTGA